MLTIDIETARRFILGKQGLWPGRRWRGSEGAEAAMRAMEYLQLDPLQIIARSQDIALHSRVLDYTPGLWEELAYQQRKFFDWSGWLAARPMDELPHWRVVMRRERDGCIGYIGHPFVKEGPWAFIATLSLVARWYSAIDRGGEWFSYTGENRHLWTEAIKEGMQRLLERSAKDFFRHDATNWMDFVCQ